MFHHPYHWLLPTNRRAFSTLIEHTSDIAIYGHEHVAYLRETMNRDGSSQLYLEAGVLQETDAPSESWFHVLVLNLEADKQKTVTLRWSGTRYETDLEDAWRDLSQNSLRRVKEFQFHKNYQEKLNESEFKFSTTKGDFTLEDLFIFPNLTEFSAKERLRKIDPKLGQSVELKVGSGHIVETIKREKRVIVYAPEKAGKTTLLKRLQVELLSDNFVPVYLDAIHLNVIRPEQVMVAIEGAFEKQYQTPNIEIFRQLSSERRVILVDNFHAPKMTNTSRNTLISRLNVLAGITILVSADDPTVHEMVIHRALPELANFRRFEIKSFGYSLREQLIQRWFARMDPYTSDEENRVRVCTQAGRYVNTVILAQLVTPYPFYVLMILQQLESQVGVDFSTASYSAFCELYVKQELKITNQTSGLERGMLERVLDLFAGQLFEKHQRALSKIEFYALVNKYAQDYKMQAEASRILDAFSANGILRESVEEIEFLHNYQYRYFVASNLARILEENRLDAMVKVRALVEELHLENSANIVVLLGHISRDREVVQCVLERAKRTFIDVEPCDFDRSTEFASRLTDRVPEVTLDLLEALEARQHLANQQDIQALPSSNERNMEMLIQPEADAYDSAVDEMDNTFREILLIN